MTIRRLKHLERRRPGRAGDLLADMSDTQLRIAVNALTRALQIVNEFEAERGTHKGDNQHDDIKGNSRTQANG
jgi:hypothetical protein